MRNNPTLHRYLREKLIYILLGLFFCFYSLCSFAQFREFPTCDYLIDAQKGLPIVQGVIEVKNITDSKDIEIYLEFPEYAPLSNEEIKIIESNNIDLRNSINIQKEIGISRKNGYLEYWFCPIIFDGGKYKRLISAKICTKHIQTFSDIKSTLKNPAVRWKENSVLSQGKWVKLKVKEEGIYSLTESLVKSWGFSNSKNIKLYGYGGLVIDENWNFAEEMQTIDDLEEVPLFRKEDGTMLFFAEGTRRWTWNQSKSKWIHENNPYSNYSYYFLTEGENPAVFATKKSEFYKALDTIDVINHYSVIDNDMFGWYHGGREMYDEYDFSFGSNHTYKIKTPNFSNSSNPIIDISFSAASKSSSTTAKIDLNGNSLGSLTVNKYGDSQSAYETRKSFQNKYLLNETNDLRISTTSNNPARLNFIRINYKKKLSGDEAPYSFSPNYEHPINLKISNANKSTQLWMIGYSGVPSCEIYSSFEDNQLIATLDNPKCRYILVDVSQNYPHPEFVREVENQNLHSDKSIDMVIIVPSSRIFVDQAQRLADFHKSKQGLEVKVVDTEQLYNEFSSGTPDASAYRRYLKMLYDRANDENEIPKYLLLFGDSYWDNRLITNTQSKSQDDFLLSFEVSDGYNNQNNTSFPIGEISSYVTDDFFGWLDDTEGNNYSKNKLDIAIGRFPCSDKQTAQILVDKTIAYMSNEIVGKWKNEIYILADYGNENLHMRDAQKAIEQIEASTNNKTRINRIFWDAYERETSGTGHTFPGVTKEIQNAMKNGALMFNYTGHGSPEQISHAKLLTTSDFTKSSNHKLPLWIMASCEISPFDSQINDIGRAAIHNPLGGAISVICASRSVYSNYNKELNVLLNKHLFSFNKEKRTTIGEALRMTKVELLGSDSYGVKDGSINKLKYVLLGNPAIPLAFPTRELTLDSINGQIINQTDYKQLKAGSTVKLCGHVNDLNGSIDHSFNGVVTLTLLDKAESIVCNNYNNINADPYEYSEHTNVIFEGIDSVINGKFDFEIKIPKSISYSDENGKMYFYAVSNNKLNEVHGTFDKFYLNGTESQLSNDTVSPKVFAYLDTPEFANGGITTPNPLLIVEIHDEHGINATDINLGQNMEIVFDNNYSNPIQVNDYFSYDFGSYKSGKIQYQFQDLSLGLHHLKINVFDINGNSTTAILDFYVKEKLENGFKVYSTINPVQTHTDLIATFDNEFEENTTISFEVYDNVGRRIWISSPCTVSANSNCCVVPWNLINQTGNKVSSGLYIFRAILKTENGQKRVSDSNKIIVTRQ